MLQTLQNRAKSIHHVAEPDLCRAIMKLREKRQSRCTEAEKRYLNRRSMFELIDLMMPKQPTEDEKKGRSSGSLSWRMQRGEMEQSNNVNSLNPIICLLVY